MVEFYMHRSLPFFNVELAAWYGTLITTPLTVAE
jgi:hypothetical protein